MHLALRAAETSFRSVIPNPPPRAPKTKKRSRHRESHQHPEHLSPLAPCPQCAVPLREPQLFHN